MKSVVFKIYLSRGTWVARWVKASAFGSGHDLRVLGSSPAPGSLLSGEPASRLPHPPASLPTCDLCQINKQNLKKNSFSHYLYYSLTSVKSLGRLNLTQLWYVVDTLKKQERLSPKFGLDIETNGTTYTPVGYENVYYSYNDVFLERAGRTT